MKSFWRKIIELDEDIISEGIALRKGHLLLMSKKKPRYYVLTPAIFAGLSLFFSLFFLLGIAGVVPAEDRSGNRVEIGLSVMALLFLGAFLTLFWAIFFIGMMFEVTKRYEIHERGILFPYQALPDQIRRKEAFVPFEDIVEIFPNDSTAALSFAVRTKKGYLNGKKKEYAWKMIIKHGSSWPMMTVLLKDGKVKTISKDEFEDLHNLTRMLEERVLVNWGEYYLP